MIFLPTADTLQLRVFARGLDVALSLGKREALEICGSLQDVSSWVASHGGGSGIYSLGRKTPTAERVGSSVGQKGRGELQPAWGASGDAYRDCREGKGSYREGQEPEVR